ncbi:MAG: hypothetical protein ACPL88_06880, partial [Bryobacteraceae bacterium]
MTARLYWKGADRLQPPDLAPGIKIAGGWVPRLLHVPVPRDHPAWQQQDGWMLSVILMDRLRGRQIEQIFSLSRLPLMIFPLLTLCLIWRWGTQLYERPVGLLLALLFAVEPTALGHGALFKNDLAATFGYLWFWYRAWYYWRAPTPRNAAWLGGALLAALLAKLSMVILLPIAPLVVILRSLSRRAPPPLLRSGQRYL